MHLIDIIENNNVVSERRIVDEISHMPFRQLQKLREELEEALRSNVPVADIDEQPPFSAFNFLASASFRGETGCIEWACRYRKAQILARYTALFCDRVVLPIRFTPDSHEPSQKQQRDVLATSLLLLSLFRPLIDYGLILPVPSEVHYCPVHYPDEVPHAREIAAYRDMLVKNLYPKLKIVHIPRQANKLKLEVRGPEEYIEHGHMFYTLHEWPSNLMHLKIAKQPRELTPEEVRSTHLVEDLVREIAIDVAVQQAIGCRFGCSYLTSKDGEATFLASVNEENSVAARANFLCAELAHSVPLFLDVPIDRVMTIRKEDYEAFASYRVVLSKIVSEHVCTGKELTAVEAKELYRDVLEPEVLSLQQQAANERRSAVKSSALKLGFVAGDGRTRCIHRSCSGTPPRYL